MSIIGWDAETFGTGKSSLRNVSASRAAAAMIQKVKRHHKGECGTRPYSTSTDRLSTIFKCAAKYGKLLFTWVARGTERKPDKIGCPKHGLWGLHTLYPVQTPSLPDICSGTVWYKPPALTTFFRTQSAASHSSYSTPPGSFVSLPLAPWQPLYRCLGTL